MKSLLGLLTVLALAALPGCSFLTPKAPSAMKELPATERFNLAERCSVAGKEYFETFTKEWNTFDTQNPPVWKELEYHYNSRLDTCLVHIRFSQPLPGGSSDSRHFNQTIDVFSDKVILYGWFSRDERTTVETLINPMGDAPNYTSAEYSRQKNILFGE